MEARAELKYARISPTKVQIVLDLIRNKRISSMCRSATQPPDPSSSVCVPEHRAEHTASTRRQHTLPLW